MSMSLSELHFVIQRMIARAVHGEFSRADLKSLARPLAGMIQNVDRRDRSAAQGNLSLDRFQDAVIDREVLETCIAIAGDNAQERPLGRPQISRLVQGGEQQAGVRAY